MAPCSQPLSRKSQIKNIDSKSVRNGTTAPVFKLDVNAGASNWMARFYGKGGGPSIAFRAATDAGANNYASIDIYDDAGGAEWFFGNSDVAAFGDNLVIRNTDRAVYYFILDESNGNLGLGGLLVNPAHPITMASGAPQQQVFGQIDELLKRDISSLDKYGLKTLLELEPKQYKMKSDDSEQIWFYCPRVRPCDL